MAPFTTRPVILARHGVVTSGHYLASAAGFRILAQGGNAIDAAAATCLVLNLVEPHNTGLGGEAPTLIYSARERKVYSVCGIGWSPQAFTIDWCRQNGIDLIPGDGFLPACVPAMLDTWCLALARFGSMTFSQVSAPAIQLAEEGFPTYNGLRAIIASCEELFTEEYPTTGKIYLPPGALIRNPDWANVLRLMAEAEANCRKGRVVGIEAARDVFYKGAVAEKILDFISRFPVQDATGQAHTGLISYKDMAEWHASLEEPVNLDFRGLEVYKCSAWTQGPVFLQQLRLLDGYDLAAMGHNSSDYLHTLIECAKLAFADREAYYGDPLFDDVPFERLFSPEYAARRRELVGVQASPDLRPGDIGRGVPEYATHPILEDNLLASHSIHTGDTTHLDTLDAEGNLVACTLSGGWFQSSPVIEGLGFPLGTRGQMFYLNPDRPNALAPHKRPRATLTPTIVTRAGHPFLAFGTQGGDAQDQWTLQFFLNFWVFGMDLQAALDAPTVNSEHFPSSFYPRTVDPLRVSVERRISRKVRSQLAALGHRLSIPGDWAHGRVLAVCFDQENGILQAAASPRQAIAYAMGW
ncbi:MAG: gamma-glutamyltransferase family protein [Anaerolineales bacterium]